MTPIELRELLSRLRFQGRYASETERQAGERRYHDRLEAADLLETLPSLLDRVEELERHLSGLVEALSSDGTFIPSTQIDAARTALEGRG